MNACSQDNEIVLVDRRTSMDSIQIKYADIEWFCFYLFRKFDKMSRLFFYAWILS